MSRLSLLLVKVPGRALLAGASLCTLVGLFFMVAPSFSNSALMIMAGMSLGHAFGLGGVLLFALAVLRDTMQKQEYDSRPDSGSSSHFSDGDDSSDDSSGNDDSSDRSGVEDKSAPSPD